MRNSMFRLSLMLILAATACSQMRDTRPTNTPLPLPSPTPFVAVRSAATATRVPTRAPTASPVLPPTSVPAATATEKPAAIVGSRPQAKPADSSGTLPRSGAPGVIESALRAAGIASNVYWFTFDAGDREEALMLQYDSPMIRRPGYDEMLLKVKAVAAQYFLRIDPPLYSLFIAATDLTGTSDTVARLRRDTVERWASGEIGDADLYNNGFEPARVILTCTGDGCTGVKPTPYPTFPAFPFPFPPTPTP